MTLSISGGDGLRRRLTAIGDTRLLLGKIGYASVAEAKRLVPRRTGNLGRSIRLGAVTKSYVDVVAGGRRDVGYAAAVEFGSRSHTIVPRKAKVLAWGGARTLGGKLRKGANAKFFARRVRHPGTRAQPYLRPGIAFGVQKITGLIIDAWNKGA